MKKYHHDPTPTPEWNSTIAPTIETTPIKPLAILSQCCYTRTFLMIVNIQFSVPVLTGAYLPPPPLETSMEDL